MSADQIARHGIGQPATGSESLARAACHTCTAGPGAIVIFQIPRFSVHQGRIHKSKQEWRLQDTVDAPIFAGQDTLRVQWHAYRVAAAIVHEGPVPTSGHYRAVLCSVRGIECKQWITQDNSLPSHQCWPPEIRANSYVVLAVRSDGASQDGATGSEQA